MFGCLPNRINLKVTVGSNAGTSTTPQDTTRTLNTDVPEFFLDNHLRFIAQLSSTSGNGNDHATMSSDYVEAKVRYLSP